MYLDDAKLKYTDMKIFHIWNKTVQANSLKLAIHYKIKVFSLLENTKKTDKIIT